MVRKLVIAVLTAVTSVAAFSESCYWQKYNGTYEGLFSESGRWRPKIPGAKDNVYARSENKEDSKIILDGDYTIGYLCLDKGSFKLDGAGSIIETSGTYKHINPGYTLEVGGSVYYKTVANQYESYGTLRLAAGAMITKIYVPGPLTEICGGAFTNSSAKYAAASVCRVSSGDYRCTSSLTFSDGAVLSVTGGRVSAASGVTFAEGSTFALTNAVLDIGKATFAAGSSIRLGEGAELRLSLFSTIKTADIKADPTAKIVFVVPDGTAAARSCPVWLPIGGELAALGVKIEVEGPAGWCGKMIGPCYFITGGVATVPTAAYEWTGAEDGYWSNGANWHGGVAPTAVNGVVYVSGENRTVITNDVEGLSIESLYIRSSSAPVVICGKPMKLTALDTGWNGDITLRSDSPYPVIFENEVVFATRYAYASERNSNASPSIEFRGGVSQVSSHENRFFWYYGNIVYGGTASFRRLLTNYGKEAPLVFLPDADYTLTEQVEGPADHGMNASLTYGGKLTMMPGSKLTVNGPWCQAANASSAIDGLLDFKGTLRGAQYWYGTGTVKTSGKYYTDAAVTNNVSIGKGMTLVPSSWNTEPAPGVVYRICATNGLSRIKAAGDWTYGPAEGAADKARELHIATGSTLVIDTEEAESGKGCTVTFVDPLAAEGSLVKDGAGTLKLPAVAFAVEGRLALNEGVLHLSAPVTVAGEFTAGDDASLSFAGDILGGERMRTVLTASSISAVPSVKGPYILKKIANAEDSTESLLLMRSGMTVILR